MLINPSMWSGRRRAIHGPHGQGGPQDRGRAGGPGAAGPAGQSGQGRRAAGRPQGRRIEAGRTAAARCRAAGQGSDAEAVQDRLRRALGVPQRKGCRQGVPGPSGPLGLASGRRAIKSPHPAKGEGRAAGRRYGVGSVSLSDLLRSVVALLLYPHVMATLGGQKPLGRHKPKLLQLFKGLRYRPVL